MTDRLYIGPLRQLSYPGFLRRSLSLATDGSLGFYAWMTMLTAIALVGANAWANQVADGMIATNMTDHVSWGLYIANFTFCVGLAAGGVMMVIPAYLYDDEEMHKVVIIGEAVAIAAIVMCTLRRGRSRPARSILAHDSRNRSLQLADLDVDLGHHRA